MFQGSMVAIVTPMHADNTIAWQTLADLIDWHIEQLTDAIVIVGTTGESAALSLEEHKAVIKFAAEHARKRIPVIAGSGGNSTAEAVELTLSAYNSGCDASLQVVPYYNKPPQRGLYQHFAHIAAAVAMPMILYNVPGRTSCDLLPETVVELAKIKNIIAIKEASTLQRIEQLRALFPKNANGDHFRILCGEDGISARAVADGLIDGVISVTANVAPRQMHDLIAAGLQGDGKLSLAIDEKIKFLHQALFVEANPIPVKWALWRMGKIENSIRLPLVELAPDAQRTVEEAMQLAKLI